jgi:flagellar hook-associated protein 2
MGLSTNLVSGLVTGFDWRTMIDQLIAVEHRRVDLVEDSKSAYEEKLSEWQSFNTKLLALKTSAEGLKDSEDFYLYTQSMSTDNTEFEAEDLLSVSTSSTAAPGTYTVKGTNLAQAQKLSSNPFTSQTAELGSSYAGDIIINSKVVTINATDSLLDVAYSINNSNTGTDPSGVTASIVNYGTNDYRLVLTSDTTGEDGISLLNGSSTNLVQKYGWKDNQTAVIKNAITNGAQSDRFTAPNVVIQSLLGLSTGESGDVTIGDQTVTLNLSTMSLNGIKDAINTAGPTGVTASVISQTVEGITYYRLHIEGTETFTDANNILNTLGVCDHNSATVKGKVSANSLTSEGTSITPDTLLVDIDGYISWTDGDYIRMKGTDTAGNTVGGGTGYIDFSITSAGTVQDLLDAIETNFGDVIAYITSDGTIRVDDLIAGESSNLSVILEDHITSGELEFVDADAAFGNATDRQREITAGENATVEIDGVEVTNSTNSIDDVIAGITLNLLSESTATVTLNVERNIDAIKSNIQGFVEKYNEVMSYINTQFAYDGESGETGGILFGDGTLRSVKSDLISVINESIWGVDSDFSVLGLVGIDSKINADNNLELSIDDTTLTGYLETNFHDVVSLFTGQGTTSASNLAYVGHTRDSEAGEYTVHINRAATRGAETGNVDLSSGGADETLTITQGNSEANISITNGMSLDDIINEVNTELDTEYTQTLVGDETLYSDGSQNNVITSGTTWNSIHDSVGTQIDLEDNDVISFAGTSRSGAAISGSYTMSNVASNTVQGLLSAIEDAFSSKATASIDTSGRIIITDEYIGTSQLAIEYIKGPDANEFFGTVDVTSGAGDGSHEGRYAMDITATDDGSNHLILRSDDYGSMTFSISQDTTDGNYDHIIYTTTNNTTDSSSGTVHLTSSTTWDDVYGANIVNNDTITISGKARNGTTDISGTYTINDISSDTINGLLTAIETAYSNQGTTVDAFIRDGKIYVEDTTAGSSSISITLTCNNEGGGSLALGTFDQNTERDLDLGLINGTVTGLNVAGTIGGEAATGSGLLLTGDDANVNTDGLAVSYTGTSNDINAGTIKLTIGIAELFDRALFNITDSIDGYVAFKQNSLQDRINDFADQIEEMEARLDKKMEMMINKFVLMELALSRLQNQSNWLTGQINTSLNGWGLL